MQGIYWDNNLTHYLEYGNTLLSIKYEKTFRDRGSWFVVD